MKNPKPLEARDSLNIKSLKHLSLQIGIPEDTILDVVNNIKKHYRKSVIKKKRNNGTVKTRVIYHRSRKLEKILKSINDNLLNKIELPDVVHGARKGYSNVTNAKAHIGKKYILKLDIADFFPSISYKYVYNLFIQLKCSPDIARILTRLCTADNHVPQGYNTSPLIATLVLKTATKRLNALCKKHGFTLTILIDDITISGNMNPERLRKTFEKIISECGFKIKSEKTTCLKKYQQQKVTGVIVNIKPNIDKKDFEEMRYYLHICKKYGPIELLNKEITNSKGERIRSLSMLKKFLQGRLSYFKSINSQKTEKLLNTFNSICWN